MLICSPQKAIYQLLVRHNGSAFYGLISPKKAAKSRERGSHFWLCTLPLFIFFLKILLSVFFCCVLDLFERLYIAACMHDFLHLFMILHFWVGTWLERGACYRFFVPFPIALQRSFLILIDKLQKINKYIYIEWYW